MNNSIDTKLNRSLLIHNLDNLVFGKRQRKNVEPAPLAIFSAPQHKPQKKKDESKQVLVSAQCSKSNNKPKRGRPPIKKNKKYSAIKTQKRSHNKIEGGSEEDILQESIESVSSDNQQVASEKSNQINTSKSKPALMKKQKSNPKQKIAPKKAYSPKKKTIESKINKIDLKREDNQYKSDLNRENSVNNTSEKQKKKRGRPKKVQPISISESFAAKTGQCQVKNQKNLQNALLADQSIKPIEQERQIQIEQKEEKGQFQNNIKDKKEQAPPEIVAFEYDLWNERARRVRMNPIRYNEDDQDINSDNSAQTNNYLRRKKKIYKGRNKTGKPYQLNRIFRKEAKKNFPAFEIKVNLNKLSLESFVKQFGVFDLVHFSLPMKFLHMMTDVPLLMEKGFVFIWVEKGETQIGYHLLNRWGFDVIDQIIWIKANQQQGKIQADDIDPAKSLTDSDTQNTKEKDIFINMKSTCLVGYKCPLGNKAQYRTKVSNNIIFAKAMQGCKKPAQIYEIADLMMPGAKKLEVGGSLLKGWLNLKHHQNSLYRCYSCFKETNLYLFVDNQKPIKCKKCIADEIDSQFGHQSETQFIKRFRQLPKKKIKQILFIYDSPLKCIRCALQEDQLEHQGLIRNADSQCLCLKCYKIKSENSDQKGVDIILKKKPFYNTAQSKCIKCEDTTFYDTFFECLKNKNAKICKECFWKTSEEEENNDKKLNKNLNEWKLKFVKNSPLMKFNCFGCKTDLNLPFWSCQTCQSWVWCGRCDKGSSQIHPHYQTDKHRQYLVI